MPKIKIISTAFALFAFYLGAHAAQAQGLQPVFEKNYTDTHRSPPSFNPKRTIFACTTWQEPAVADADAERWYKGATRINAQRYRRSPDEYQQMLMLYEAAARKGHYKAVKDLIITYSISNGTMKGVFPPEPKKARYWLHYALDKNWSSAFEWLSYALHDGSNGYPANSRLSLAYMQQAANMGVASAQYELANIYDEMGKTDIRDILLSCAMQQNFGPALARSASLNRIYQQSSLSLQQYQQALVVGGGG